MLFSFEGAILQRKDPVTIAKWTHLNSYRTQKLSTSAAKIVGLAPANIARCRVLFFGFFSLMDGRIGPLFVFLVSFRYHEIE